MEPFGCCGIGDYGTLPLLGKGKVVVIPVLGSVKESK